jgi:hypothetical protein
MHPYLAPLHTRTRLAGGGLAGRPPSPHGGGPIPVVAAAAALGGAAMGWWANRRSSAEKEQATAGQGALQFQDQVAQNMLSYGDDLVENTSLQTAIREEKRQVQALQQDGHRYRTVLNALKSVGKQYHRIPHPTSPAYEILIPRPSLMKLLSAVQYTSLIRKIRQLSGGGPARQLYAAFDEEAIHFLRKHRTKPASFFASHFDSSLQPQIPQRLQQINDAIRRATQGENFSVDGISFSSVGDMNKSLQKVRSKNQLQESELDAHQKQIAQLKADNTQLELEVGRTCNSLFRKWLKAPGEQGNGVPIAIRKR